MIIASWPKRLGGSLCKKEPIGVGKMNKKILFIGFLVLGFAITSLDAQTWSKLKRLTWNSGRSWDVSIAIRSGDDLHLVWQDSSTPYSTHEILYKRSTDGGTSWSSTRRLTWTHSNSFNPAIAADSANNIYIAWEQYIPGDFEICYKKSTNGGNTWSGDKRLTWTSEDSFSPSVAVNSANHIYIVWSDLTAGNREIFFKKSTNGGNSWSGKRLSWSSGWAETPNMVVDSYDDIHVVWSEDTPGNGELYYKKSTNSGANWTATKRLTWTSGNSYCPAIAADSSDVLHVAWQDEVGGVETIFYKKSTNSGATWIGTKRLTWGANISLDPAITSDSVNRVHVIWRKEISSKWYSFYRRGNAAGVWGSTKRLTWNSNFIIYPDIAIDSADKIHAVWEDDKPGNSEIFYKKGIQ
jgi:hypothetical protein